MPKIILAIISLHILILCLSNLSLNIVEAKASSRYSIMAGSKKNMRAAYLQKVHPFLKKLKLTESMKSLLHSLRKRRRFIKRFTQRRKRNNESSNNSEAGPMVIALPPEYAQELSSWVVMKPDSFKVVSPNSTILAPPSQATTITTQSTLQDKKIKDSIAPSTTMPPLQTKVPQRSITYAETTAIKKPELNNIRELSKSMNSFIIILPSQTDIPTVRASTTTTTTSVPVSTIQTSDLFGDIFAIPLDKLDSFATATEFSAMEAMPMAPQLRGEPFEFEHHARCDTCGKVKTTTDPLLAIGLNFMPQSNSALNIPDTLGGIDKHEIKENAETMGKILKGVEDIRNMQSQTKEKEGFPCNATGSWSSLTGGVILNLTKSHGILNVSLSQKTPPCVTGLLINSSSWNMSGIMPFEQSGRVVLIGINERDKQILSFVGECRICSGIETVTGNWLHSYPSRDCNDQKSTTKLFGDLWRREMLTELRQEKFEHIKQLKISSSTTDCCKKGKTVKKNATSDDDAYDYDDDTTISEETTSKKQNCDKNLISSPNFTDFTANNTASDNTSLSPWSDNIAIDSTKIYSTQATENIVDLSKSITAPTESVKSNSTSKRFKLSNLIGLHLTTKYRHFSNIKKLKSKKYRKHHRKM